MTEYRVRDDIIEIWVDPPSQPGDWQPADATEIVPVLVQMVLKLQKDVEKLQGPHKPFNPNLMD